MADVFTKAKRSEVMSRIRSSNNASTELRLIKIMRSERITGWRRRQRLPGNPDFVFRDEKLTVFVDGCFWHCCPKCSTRPETNAEFWQKKFDANRKRDLRVRRELRARGWNVLRIWEHELRYDARVTTKLLAALGRLHSND